MGRAKSRRELVAARFKPLIDRLPAREPVEGVMPLNPGYFTVEAIRTEARPKERGAERPKMQGRA